MAFIDIAGIDKRFGSFQALSGINLAIVTFRYAPSDMDDEQCDALNEAISRQVMAENIAAPLTTRIDGRTVLRICAINPDTSIADISEVVAALDARAVALRAAR
jgi:glutamate/tyrosine decarboxylase-like PLP-dependent enzyme